MRNCAACGATNADDAQFCASCGTGLQPACLACGASLPFDARFCSACGTPVHDTPAGEERKLVTILFADVTGSTALGEQLDPERLRDVLATYFAAMREEIEAEGGTVEKFIGDAVMAAFGVPAAHEDDPARALRASLRMLDRLEQVNRELRAGHGVELQIRIGVNTGHVLATTLPRPGEPMVTGDAVNAAARLQAAADPGEIVAGERTARAVRGFTFEELGGLELRGKAEPVRAFRVRGSAPLLEERGVEGLQAPMVGRDAELALLRTIYERVESERRPNLVTIYGDAGVGKSRLTREFGDWAEDRDPSPAQLRGRCLPYGKGVTYWPLAEILKASAGILDSDPPALVREKIGKIGDELLTPEVTADPARTAAALAFTVGVEDPSHSFAEMDPKDVRAEVHGAWRSFFSALGTGMTTVVVVEDIHWADGALLDLLEELAERVVGAVLFICPSRPELTARRSGWGGGRRNFSSLSLDPLSANESEHLVRELLAIDALTEDVRDRILERGEGNPFFLEEILRHLIDEAHVVRQDGRWRAAEGLADVEIPDTVQGVLAARIDLLEGPVKLALQAAAVVGREFWPGPVRLVSGSEAVGDALEVLLRRDLIVSRLSSTIAGEQEYSFKHVLTHDVAYVSLPRRERARAHAVVAGWIEATAGSRAREFNEVLAYHYGTAFRAARELPDASPAETESLREKAFRYLLAASEDARRRLVLPKAESAAEEALELSATDRERVDALEVLAEAFFTAYTGDMAWRYFREAAFLCSRAEPVDDARVAYLAARASEIPQRWPGSMRGETATEDEVEEVLELGLRHLPEGDTEGRVRLLSVRAGWFFAFPKDANLEKLEASEAAGIEAANIAMRIGKPNLASGALDAANAGWVARGWYGRAIPLWERRREVMPHVTDILETSDFYSTGIWSFYSVGDYESATRVAEEGFPIVDGKGPIAELHFRAWRSVLWHRLGRWDHALDDFARVRGILADARDEPPYFATHAFGVAGQIHEARGRSTESLRLAELLLGLKVKMSARSYPQLLRLLVERGELDRARSRERPSGWRVHAGDAYEAEAERAAATASWDEARALLTEMRAHAVVAPAPSVAAFADRLEGRGALASGDAGRATELLTLATEAFADLSIPWERALTELDLAAALSAVGRDDEARGRLAAAVQTFEILGAARDLTRANALLATL